MLPITLTFWLRAVIPCITLFMVGSSVDDSREEWKEQFVAKGVTVEVPGMSW